MRDSALSHSFTLLGRSKGGKAVATQFPMWDNGALVYYWADKGLIHWEDTRPKCPPHRKRGAMSWQDAARRVLALSQMIFNTSPWEYDSERKKLQAFIEEMESVIRTAKEQGGPFDGPSVRRDYVRRRPCSVVMPREVNLAF